MNCEKRAILFHHPLYLIPVVIGTTLAVLALFLSLYLMRNFSKRTLYHPNVSILLIVTLLCSFIMAIIVAFSHVYFLQSIFRIVEPCDLFVKTSFCTSFRSTFLCAFVVLTVTHTGIMFERLWATISLSKYEKKGLSIGVTLSILSVVISIITIYFVTINEDPEELITNCLTFSAAPSVSHNIYVMFRVQLVINVLIIAMHYGLTKSNLKRLKFTMNNDLSTRFQREENLKILRQTKPIIWTCSIVIATYIFVLSFVRLFRENLPPNWYELIAINLFVISYLPSFLTITMYIMMRKETAEKKQHLEKSIKSQSLYTQKFHATKAQEWENHFENTIKRAEMKNKMMKWRFFKNSVNT